MKQHNLKLLAMYFDEVEAGFRNFQIRKHDRDFKIGDKIKLNEIDCEGIGILKPTGRSCVVQIESILRSDHGAPFEGLEEGYSILGTKLVYVA